MLSRATEKVLRLHAKALAQEVGIQAGVVVAPAAEFDHLADRLFRATMYLNGYYLYGSEWRKQEGESAMLLGSDGNYLAPFPPHQAPMPIPKKNPRRAIIEPMCQDPAIQQTLDQAAAGDPAALPAIRTLLTAPHFVSMLGNVANIARDRVIGAIAGDNLAVDAAVRQQAAEMEAKLLAECTSPLSFVERLAVTRVVNNWLALHYVEVVWASQRAKSDAADAVARQLKPVQKSYDASLKALATLRRLCKPTLEVQVNGAAGEVVGNNAPAAMTVAGELANSMTASTTR